MAQAEQRTLLSRLLSAIGLGSDEVAAGHGSVPETGQRPSTQSRHRTRQHQRERATDDGAERAADAIAEATNAMDEQIRDSVMDSDNPMTSEEMVKEAKKRWSSD